MTNRRSSRLERAISRAVRLEFARRSNWNLEVEMPTRPMELTESTIATLEKRFPTRETLHKELGTVKSELREEIGALRSEMHTEIGLLRVEMAKIPLETIKWFFAFSGIVAAIVFGAIHLM